MDALKLTTLALLIPAGALLPETTLAYPEQLNGSRSAIEQGKDRRCFQQLTRRPEVSERDAESAALPDMIIDSPEPPSTTASHHYRNQPTDACRLNLNLIETN